MWIYTKNGFYSACENKDDNSLIHVRTQFRGDLEYLREVAADYNPSEVVATPTGDYSFRLNIPREGWQYFLDHEAKDIDYTAFKSSVKDTSSTRQVAYFTCFVEMMRAGTECLCAESKSGNAYN